MFNFKNGQLYLGMGNAALRHFDKLSTGGDQCDVSSA